MKKLIINLMFLACLGAGVAFGQTSYKIEGKTITSEFVEKQKTPEKQTGYTYQDKDGKSYQVYISKNGRCYYKKTSTKTGNENKYYLDEKTSRQIAQEMNIEYKERKKQD